MRLVSWALLIPILIVSCIVTILTDLLGFVTGIIIYPFIVLSEKLGDSKWK